MTQVFILFFIRARSFDDNYDGIKRILVHKIAIRNVASLQLLCTINYSYYFHSLGNR